MQSTSRDRASDIAVAPVPILIAETGHRDLVAAEVGGLRRRVRTFFSDVATRWPDAPLALMTSLAEGAGRLVAHEALDMRIPLIIVLPMPARLYRDDFADDASRADFDELCGRGQVYELPLVAGSTLDDIAVPGSARDQQYAQLGVFLSSHCHILLALWDGKPLRALGGTAQVVEYHLEEEMPGYVGVTARPKQIIADGENDIVYHVVCSRDREDGAPRPDLAPPLQAMWLTSDLESPRTTKLPDAYAAVFDRCQQFNRDFFRHRHDIEATDSHLLPKSAEQRPSVAERIESLFRVADWLAVRYQQNVQRTQRATYVIALLMGLVFIVYSHLLHSRALLIVFLVLFGVGFGVYLLARQHDWHRKYLDYRGLAEGLRVQFYWEIAGVRDPDETNFAHDTFLQRQDMELGWIRNVMRWAQLRREPLGTPPDSRAVETVMAAWVGASGASGQLDYYARKARERDEQHRRTRRLAMSALCTGITFAVLVAILHSMISDLTRNVLLVFMGLLPLFAAVHEAYSHKRADKELIKQYRFMYRLFANARHHIERAESVHDRRDVLRTLGDACLTEHAEWIRMNRERPLEHGKLAG